MKQFYFLPISVLAMAIWSCETPLQRADTDFDVSVSNPTYKDDKPVILFDEAHNNFHTTDGLYEPFAGLVKNDGYELRTLQSPLTAQALTGIDVFVIANAKGTGDLNDTPAFSDQEVNILHDWIDRGGSLLLIADHFPFGSAVENLAKSFRIDFQKGLVQDSLNFDKPSKDFSQLEFSKENQLLPNHPLTEGVSRVVTFTGQSIACKDSCFYFLKLSDTAYDMTPVTKVTKDGDDTRVQVTYETPASAKGRAQGIALSAGKGRIVCLGEAAMLTAQKNRDDQNVGMNHNPDNKTLALNIMHWLTEKK